MYKTWIIQLCVLKVKNMEIWIIHCECELTCVRLNPSKRNSRNHWSCEFYLQDGLNNGTTGVEIKVADIQNSPPEFLDSLTGVVREDDPIGTLVMTVKARDGDRGMPRKMIYELVTSKYSIFFLFLSKSYKYKFVFPSELKPNFQI